MKLAANIIAACGLFGSYSRVSALTPLEARPVADALRALIPDTPDGRRDFCGGVVRLATHDAMGSGGADGCLDLSSNSGNEGLQEVIGFLQPTFDDIGQDVMSRGDFWAMASVLCVRSTGGHPVVFEWGRVDCADEALADSEGLIPESDPAGSVWGHVTDVFTTRMGFTSQEIVALMGAHTLGRAQAEISGFEGAWVNNPSAFDNEFYRSLLDVRWNRRRENGLEVWVAGDRIMLPTDIALAVDPDSCSSFGGNRDPVRDCTPNAEGLAIVQRYAEDNREWSADFAAAFQKLLAIGTSDLQLLVNPEIGVGYCDGDEFMDGVAVGSLDECAQACLERGNCLFYSFCDEAKEECIDMHANFCATYGDITCELTNEASSGYTTYQSLQGPGVFVRPRPPNGDGQGGPRPNGGGRPGPNGDGQGGPRPNGDGQQGRPPPNGDGQQGRPPPNGDGPQGRPPPNGDGQQGRPSNGNRPPRGPPSNANRPPRGPSSNGNNQPRGPPPNGNSRPRGPRPR